MAFLAHAGDEVLRRADLRTVVPLPVRSGIVGRLVEPPGMEREDVAVLPAPGLVHRVVESPAVDASGEAERGNLDFLLQFQRGAGVVERLQPVAVVVHAPVDFRAARPEVQFVADFHDRAVPRGGLLQLRRREREALDLVRRLAVQMEREDAAAVLLRVLFRIEAARGADPPCAHPRQEPVAGLLRRDVEAGGDAHDARVERLVPVRLDRRHVRPHEGVGAPVVERGVHEPVFARPLRQPEGPLDGLVGREDELERLVQIDLAVVVARRDAAGHAVRRVLRVHHRNRERGAFLGRIEEIEVLAGRDARRERRARLERRRRGRGVLVRQEIEVDDVRIGALAGVRGLFRRLRRVRGARPLRLREVLARRRHDHALGVFRRQFGVAQGFRRVDRPVFDAHFDGRLSAERPDRVVPQEEPAFRRLVRHQRRAPRLVRLAVRGLLPHPAAAERLAERGLADGIERDDVAAERPGRRARPELLRPRRHHDARLDPQPRTALRDNQRIRLLDVRILQPVVDAHDLRIQLDGILHVRPNRPVLLLLFVHARIREIVPGQFQEIVALEVADDRPLPVRPRHEPVLRRGPLRRHLAQSGARGQPQSENASRPKPSLHDSLFPFCRLCANRPSNPTGSEAQTPSDRAARACARKTPAGRAFRWRHARTRQTPCRAWNRPESSPSPFS